MPIIFINCGKESDSKPDVLNELMDILALQGASNVLSILFYSDQPVSIARLIEEIEMDECDIMERVDWLLSKEFIEFTPTGLILKPDLKQRTKDAIKNGEML